MSKRALLIGINKYLVPGADLRGCVNDVKNLAGVLTSLYGFRKGDVRLMTDADATKRSMQAGIRELIRSGRKGDVLVLHYSGHGSNVPDKSGDEADERDEILCPHDLDWKDPLTDDWLRSTFDSLKSGVNLTVIMDCCHSGTNTRAIQPPDAPIKQRFLPNPLDLLAAESGRRLRGRVTGELRRSPRAARGRGDIVSADIPELLVTGCRDTQTSADAFIDGSYTGALTYALVDAMRKTNGRLTYRDLHGRALAALQRRRFEQVPQLEGLKAAFDRPVFA